MIGGAFLIVSSGLAVSEPDARQYQRALESGRPAECMPIANETLRTRCRVELGDHPAACNTIIDPQQRALCQAKGKRK